ncbi:CidA/LrgA family holin-like protein [Thermoactinomyces sp. CICC 23799]|jgi:holin-like protein|uniref:CidA/LrgA family holin-like protein n=1 Tax=Thermoactinomyces sp. CICC 23799 TaxID=2767429 RepID=UPI0018DBCDA1|nr:CidA/LrgA family holin-like protein [Thermoactinomyces sp. CICC 23799]MBH8601813.1 CidA/LrgA family holin-like protein [Thermoactinomyces sp. CICC 23799]
MFAQMLKTVLQIGGIYLFYETGVWIQQKSHVPIPGSMIGLFLLFICLSTGLVRVHWLQSGADVLLSWLPLLFLPSVIGVIEYAGFLRRHGLQAMAVVVISTVLVMCLSGWLAQWLAKRKEGVDERMDQRGHIRRCHARGVHRDETSV